MENVPSGHAVHSVAFFKPSVLEYVPMGQSLQPEPSEFAYFPAAHFEQEVDPADENKPAAHFVHVYAVGSDLK